MTVGDYIRSERKKAGLTQKELGAKLGISAVGIAQWENGLRNPKHESIKRIADALNISETVLYGVPERDSEELQRSLEKSLDEAVDPQGNVDVQKFEERLLDNDAKIKYGDLLELRRKTDDLYRESLKNWTDERLLKVLTDSFLELNRVGKIEAVKRIAEMEAYHRFSDNDLAPDDPGEIAPIKKA